MTRTSAAIDVSIVIVSWNTKALVLECLSSLPAAVGTRLAYEVLLVDNASSDDTVAAVGAGHHHVMVIANQVNRGFAAANNQAIRIAGGRYVLLLNSDTIPEAGSIAVLVDAADREPRSGAVGGMLLHADGRFQASFQDAPGVISECVSAMGIGRRLGFEGYPSYGSKQSQSPRRVEVIPGACMLLRRAALDQVGLLDESYFMYSEETDLCRRLRDQRWDIWYQPSARVLHYGGQSAQQARVEMVRALYRSKVRYIALHDGAARALILRALLTLILGGKWAVASLSPAARRRVPLIRWRDLEPSPAADARSVPV